MFAAQNSTIFEMFTELSLIVFVSCVCALCVWLFLCQAYSRMLTDAFTPWYLEAPVGEYVLLLYFKLGTISRKLCPSVVNKGMQEAANAKADELVTISPKKGGICFIGSSTFTYWKNLNEDFKELNIGVFNSAFGGSCTHDIIPNIRKLCTVYSPSVVVYFCGTNNVAQGLPAESVLEGVELFSKEYFSSCPEGHIVLLAITRTPLYLKWNINNCIPEAARADSLVQDFCNLEENKLKHTFITSSGNDVGLSFVADTGNYLGDNHHLNDKGHTMLAKQLLIPAIKKVLKL